MARPNIDITDEMVVQAEHLASIGFSDKHIAEGIHISLSTLQRNMTHFEASLKKGRLALRQRIAGHLLSKIDEQDTTALIFACKRLNLFQSTMEVTKPTNPQEVVAELSKVYEAVAEGSISEAQGEKLVSVLQHIHKGIELGVMEERLKALESKAFT